MLVLNADSQDLTGGSMTDRRMQQLQDCHARLKEGDKKAQQVFSVPIVLILDAQITPVKNYNLPSSSQYLAIANIPFSRTHTGAPGRFHFPSGKMILSRAFLT